MQGAAQTAQPSQAENFAAELSQWESRVAQLQADKQAEVEQQSRVIGDLTARVQQLEPLSGLVAEREQEIASWSERYAELQRQSSEQLAQLEAEQFNTDLGILDETNHEGDEELLAQIAELQPIADKAQETERRAESLENSLNETS